MIAPHVRLANDVAAQFAHLPPDTAAERIATHLRMFWDPRMRAQLLSTVDTVDTVDMAAGADGADDLDPLAAAAARLLRTPTPR